MSQELKEAYGLLQNSAFEVQDSPDFRRIMQLPTRQWDKYVQDMDLTRRMSDAFRVLGGQQTLRAIQAAALAEAHDVGGFLGPIKVGEGKTLISYLLPTVLSAERPVLLLDAALIEKTWREFQELKRHWVSHWAWAKRGIFDMVTISYQLLGRESGKDKLYKRRPTLIIADECHMLRNRDAACTRRVERFMMEYPETRFCAMSGTITNRSLHDYWHLLYFALRHSMPLPVVETEMERWAEVLDEKKVEATSRRAPGVLMQLCTPEEQKQAMAAFTQRTAPLGTTQSIMLNPYREQIKWARKGYQRRFKATPGVVSSVDEALSCSITLRRCFVEPGERAAELLDNLRETRESPNGDLLALPTDVWRMARELACDFWYRWEPAAPKEWLDRRRAWNWMVRQVLDKEGMYYEHYRGQNIDSPMQVALAVKEGRIQDVHIVKAYKLWSEIRDTFKINSVAEWVGDNMINYCAEWMHRNKSGIVWTEHRAFGIRLAQVLGTGFCSNGGMDANGKMIEDYRGRPVVASVQANHKGRNLQAWHRNLIVTAKPTGQLWEQLLGRTHRSGQKADTVYFDWISACIEQDEGFQQVLADARYIQETTGQAQKVLYADRI